jgi:hypothetical protein
VVARLRAQGVTVAALLNSDDDPTPLILPAVTTLAGTEG